MNLLAIYKRVAQIFSVFITLLPTIIKAILAVEAVFPGAGQGNAKRDAIRDGLEAAFEVVSDGKIDFKTEIWPLVERFIAKKVAAYNASKWPDAAEAAAIDAGGGTAPTA